MDNRFISPRWSRRQLLGWGAALIAAPHAFTRADEFGDVSLHGAGSTLVQPLMESWVRQYRADPHLVIRPHASGGGLDDALSSDALDYEPVGSLAGIQRIRARFVDFAASEMPLHADYLKSSGLMQFPWVFGGVAIVANIAGAEALTLDAPTLAAIYSGRITRWSDPKIATLNPALELPDDLIHVLHRSDGSGSTYTFSQYLSRKDADWQRRVGSDLTLQWPVGKGVDGSSKMAAAVKSTAHSIGYVGAAQAMAAGLGIAGVCNAAGERTLPQPGNIAAAVASIPGAGADPTQLPIDVPGASSYPLVATVFGLLQATKRSARQRRTAAFVRWTLTGGSKLTRQLGYVSLPERLAQSTLTTLASNESPTSTG